MIESIQISNFQSHKDSILNFTPGVNVIIGQSDCGKTAIIRALRWVRWNRPTGDSIRSWWGGDTQVIVTTSEHSISRIRSAKENIYKLGTLEFKAMGSDVPEEIVQALNLTDINLQQQLDQPFLLSDSPGEVAQHFNKVAQLDVIDRALSSVQKWIRSLEQDLKARQRQNEETQAEFEKFDYLEQMEQKIEGLEYLEQERIKLFQDGQRLKGLLTSIVLINSQIQKKQYLLELEIPVNQVLELYQKRRDILQKKEDLQYIMDLINKNQIRIETLQRKLKVKDLVDNAISLFTAQKGITENIKELKQLISAYNHTSLGIKNAEEHLAELKAKMPDTCSFCGQTMPKEII